MQCKVTEVLHDQINTKCCATNQITLRNMTRGDRGGCWREWGVALRLYLNCIRGAVIIPFFLFLDLLDLIMIGKILYLKEKKIYQNYFHPRVHVLTD